jgi:hypothetical protein
MSPKLAVRLSKLLPLLASDKEGEVLATVQAIRAALLGEGLDLHDLSASIANGEVVATPRAPQIAAAPTWDHLTHQECHAWMKVLLSDPGLGKLERERLGELEAILKTGCYYKVHWRRVCLFDERLASAHARGMRP